MKYITLTLLFTFLFQIQVLAYPEFYEYAKQISGRKINCALCHAHGEGPEGFEAGQIGSLNKEEMEKLMRARNAFEPGVMSESPILNAFGNQIVFLIGRKKFLELRTHPQDLPTEIGFESDIDKDGIKDAQEYLDGTLSTSAEDGHPWKLFVANFKKNIVHILLALCSVLLLLFGFINWLKGICEPGKECK